VTSLAFGESLRGALLYNLCGRVCVSVSSYHSVQLGSSWGGMPSEVFNWLKALRHGVGAFRYSGKGANFFAGGGDGGF